jgi:hypothetical protein
MELEKASMKVYIEMSRLPVELEAGVALVSILNTNHFCHLLHQVSL